MIPAGDIAAPLPDIGPPVPRDRSLNPDDLLVGSFFHDGKQWWVTINLDVGDRGNCAGLEYSVGGGETTGAGDCESATPTHVPDQNDVGIWPLPAWGTEEQLEIVGPVAKDVESLELRFTDGSRRAVDIVETASSTGWEVDVFAAFLPPDAAGDLVALDEKGAVLDTAPLPAEEGAEAEVEGALLAQQRRYATDGELWVYDDTEHGLCLETVLDDGSGSGRLDPRIYDRCGSWDPRVTGINHHVGFVLGQIYVAGTLPADAVELEVRATGDVSTRVDAEVTRLPSRFADDTNVFFTIADVARGS